MNNEKLDRMRIECLFAVFAVFGILLLAGCVLIPSSQQQGNVTAGNVIEGGSNITGVETPQMILPDINDSESDFPLPV